MFNNPERGRQLTTFNGMQYGMCRPTDLDLTMDFRGHSFVFCELKLGTAPLTDGQRYYLRNVVNGLLDGGRDAVAIWGSHDVEDPTEDIVAKDAKVVQVYTDARRWITLPQDITVGEYVENFYQNYLSIKSGVK